MASSYDKDPDRVFFEICRKAYPYFLHAEPEFTNRLISLMRAIDIAHNDMNKSDFPDLVERAVALIDNWDKEHIGVTKDIIRRHYRKVTTLDEKFEDIYELVRGHKGKQVDKEILKIKDGLADVQSKFDRLSENMNKFGELFEDPERLERYQKLFAEAFPGKTALDILHKQEPQQNDIMTESSHTLDESHTKQPITRRSPETVACLEKIKDWIKTNSGRTITNFIVRDICKLLDSKKDAQKALKLLQMLAKDGIIEHNKQRGKSSGWQILTICEPSNQ